MAEVKNAFIKSKMNKDLDSRLLPSGEYRNAINAQVSRSEGSDVGALENVLGNTLIESFSNGVNNLLCIGFLVDEINNDIYLFLTDNNTDVETYTPSGPGSNHFIYKYNPETQSTNLLVTGAFLNFSKLNPIYGVNLLENLLFWTDNRNQPRKINVVSALGDAGSVVSTGLNAIGSGYSNGIYNTVNQVPGGSGVGLTVQVTTSGGAIQSVAIASAGSGYKIGDLVNILGPGGGTGGVLSITDLFYYYSLENQISVAKYNPYKAIDLFKESTIEPGDYETTMKDVTSKFMPNGGSCVTSQSKTASNTVTVDQISIPFYPKEPLLGMTVKKINSSGAIVPLTLSGVNVIRTVVSFSVSSLTLNGNFDVDDNVELIFNENPYYINNYAGDPNLNKDNFIRFSYRFRFNDGEYSIMAPFTQTCFIPEQDGYFLTQEVNQGDEEQTYSSTIVSFMQNKVDKINLQVPLPSIGSSLSSEFNISEIDILYKESDGLSVKVVESVPISELSSNSSSVYEYSYQSQKPYKTLPSSDITRVYDKIPVRAFGQEIISNRIVYSNFQNKHTPPAFIDYNVSAGIKSSFALNTGVAVSEFAASYTAGDSIPIINATGTIVVGSLISSVYPSDNIPTGTRVTQTNGSTTMVLNNNVVLVTTVPIDFIVPIDSNTTSSVEYPNNSLKTNRNYQVGVVLSDKFGRQSTVILSNSDASFVVGGLTYEGSTLYSPYIDEGVEADEWFGNSLKMIFNNTLVTGSYNSTTNEPGVYNGDSTSSSYNPLGWYSYKIVVKQIEQEYYNVYSAGAMKGLPYDYELSPPGPNTNLDQNTSFITLINDNINKVPRDLSIVGPQDKSFRSSVVLFGRVENSLENIGGTDTPINKQFYTGRDSFTTSSIEDLFGLFDISSFEISNAVVPITDTTNPYSSFYKSQSDPFIAQITTSQQVNIQFGVNNRKPQNSIYNSINELAVFETAPTVSALDIFWETSSSGLVNDLNSLIVESGNAGGGISDFNANLFTEAIQTNQNILSSTFTIVDAFGANIDPTDFQSDVIIESVFNQQSPALNVNLQNPYFEIYKPDAASAPQEYNIRVTQDFINDIFYGSDSDLRNFVFTFSVIVNNNPRQYFTESVSLINVAPVIDQGQIPPASFNSLVSTEAVAFHAGTNGAWSSNPNKTSELSWSITSQTNANGVDVSTGQFPYFSMASNNSASNQVNNDLFNIPPSQYTIVVQLQDARGIGLSDTVTDVVNYIANINLSQSYYLTVTTGQQFDDTEEFPAFVFEVTNFGLPFGGSANGFYVYDGTFADLTNNAVSGNIVLDLTGANSCSGNWFYSSTSKEAAIALWKVCLNPPQGTQNEQYSNFNTSNFVFSIK